MWITSTCSFQRKSGRVSLWVCVAKAVAEAKTGFVCPEWIPLKTGHGFLVSEYKNTLLWIKSIQWKASQCIARVVCGKEVFQGLSAAWLGARDLEIPEHSFFFPLSGCQLSGSHDFTRVTAPKSGFPLEH